MAQGVGLDRKPTLTPHQQKLALARDAKGKETVRAIAQSYNVHHSTISRLPAHV
jgi:IS30 family transposase